MCCRIGLPRAEQQYYHTQQRKPWQVDAFPDASVASLRMSGLLVLVDWIASNEELYHYRALAPHDDLPEYYLAARQEAVATVQRLHLHRPPRSAAASPTLSFSALWPECSNLRPMQQTLETLCQRNPPPPGLAIIEALMGEGKTEAAIYLAEYWRRMSGCDGIYLALPNMANRYQDAGPIPVARFGLQTCCIC